MRLFVAVELPSDVAAAAAAVSGILRDRVSRTAPRARLTWAAPERMHLTLRFIGEVDAQQTARIVRALAEPLPTAAFALTIGAPGVFPPRGAPRVLWLGVERGAQDLRQLAREVSDRLEQAGVPPADEPYIPHLTLARVRDPRGLHTAAVLEDLHPSPGAGSMVDAITLFESRLSPKGSTYTALQRTPLHRD